jgi:uncharacterized protein
MPLCYLDTSAVIKRYIEEPNSAAFDTFFLSRSFDFVISPLVITEITSALAKRARQRDITSAFASSTKQIFQDEVLTGSWDLMEFVSSTFSQAASLISTLNLPLATLDALHLACALTAHADALATADKQLATAATKSGLQVFTFF